MGRGLPCRARVAARALAAGALAAAGCLGPLAAAAQEQDTATARIQAALLEPGSVLSTADMDFGRIAQSATPGTIALSPQASATCTATGGLVRTGPCQAARFSIFGRRNNRVRIRENNGGQVVLTGPGGATMSVSNLTIATLEMTSVNGANGWNLGNYRIDANSGITKFYLGGTLNVGAAQAPGVYNGELVIQIQFN